MVFITTNAGIENVQMVIDHTGNVGISAGAPNAKLQIGSGDVYVENSANGIILKAPNGSCYRVTVNNAGTLVSTLITCP